MNAVASAMLAKARSYIGEMESPANSNRHPTVTWYNKTIEYLAASWNYCAAGVSREFENSVAKGLYKPRAYVPWSIQDFEKGYAGGRLIWIDDWDDLLREGRPGDVVFFDWEATKRHSSWVGDHIGVLESVNPFRKEAITIEHNTSVAGTGNQGTTRKVRDAKYICALGRPAYPAAAAAPKIPGTNLPLLEVDGDMGGKTIFALGTVLKARGYKVIPARVVNKDLVIAIQTDLRKNGKKDADGKAIVVDGKGFGSNSSSRYPKVGWTRTISALQRGHGVKASRADGVFDKGESSEVKRIQRDINLGGTKDSPLFTG